VGGYFKHKTAAVLKQALAQNALNDDENCPWIFLTRLRLRPTRCRVRIGKLRLWEETGHGITVPVIHRAKRRVGHKGTHNRSQL
jgi:hypothetical protein